MLIILFHEYMGNEMVCIYIYKFTLLENYIDLVIGIRV